MTKLYDKFQKAKLYGALSGVFDFDADYEAYEAHVTGDRDTLARLTKERRELVGTPKFIMNPKRDPRVKGSWAYALAMYEKAQRGRKKDFTFPAHLVKVEKDTAYFSHERPKKVETPFGGEADNTETLS
jgi:hypothetical protein